MADPFSTWDVGGCGCSEVSVFAAGCGGRGIGNATLNVYSSPGGPLIASGQSVSSGPNIGLFTFGYGGGTDDIVVYVTYPSVRFLQPTVFSHQFGLQGTPSPGYACSGFCAYPIKKTLYATYKDPNFTGSISTLTWALDPISGNSGFWNGTLDCGNGWTIAVALQDFSTNGLPALYPLGSQPLSIFCPENASFLSTFSWTAPNPGVPGNPLRFGIVTITE